MSRDDRIELYPPDCPACYSEDPCGCEAWQMYWDALTPEEQREEERAIARYTSED